MSIPSRLQIRLSPRQYSDKRSKRFQSTHPVEPNSLWCESLEQRDLLTLPPGFSIEPFVGGLVEPIAVAYAPDGRIFVAEKAGRVQVISQGHVVGTFIDLRNEVNSKQDRGLIGLALDPNFAVNRRVYLNFTVELQPTNPDASGPAGGSLIRVAALANNPNVADLSTRLTLLSGHDNPSTTHSVGDIEFDGGGNLIMTWGDGGFLDSLRLAAQDPNSKQGKIFRIETETGAGVPGNPYYDAADPLSVRSRVLALGVRNAWRISKDAVTGNIYFGDVTDGGPEEINLIPPTDVGTQLNFGWPYYEGRNRTNYGTPPAGFQSTYPYISYNHIGNYDAITNGVMFRGDKYPSSYAGKFFFANFGQDVVYTADASGAYTEFGRNEWSFPVDIHLAPSGRIQMASIVKGTLYELVHNTAPSGRPQSLPAVTSISGLTVQFNSAGSTDPTNDALSFFWDFDQDGIIDSTQANPSFTYTSPGTSMAHLTVVDPSGNSSPGSVQVNVSVENLAVGKPSAQSSTLFGEVSSIAVDDSLTTGHTSTDFDYQAWWQVDLQSVQTIGEIALFNRLDFTERLSNYYLMVSDTPFTSPGLSDAMINADWVYHDPGQAGISKVWTVGQRGRYVRVQLAGTNSLSLREVRVYKGETSVPVNDPPVISMRADTQFGEAPRSFKFFSNGTTDPNGNPITYAWDFGDGQKSKLANPANVYVAAGAYTVRLTVTDSKGATANKAIAVNVLPKIPSSNLALGKPTAQSTTSYGGVSARAVDGNEAGDHARKRSVSHTALQRQPFWEVDLGRAYHLDVITLFNRTDAGPNKLKDAWILVSNTPFESGNLEAVRSAPGTWSVFHSGLLGPQRDIAIGQQGRYVRVQLAGDNAALALAEVVVRGSEVTTFRYNSHLYQLTAIPLTWSDARAQARALGGTLVVIDDASENDFLATTFGAGLFHTDLTDQYLEGQFGWESDQILGFSNWDAGQPADASEANDFGLLRGSDGKWLVGNATDLRFAIIEIGNPLPSQFFYFNGKVYGLTQNPLTWQTARQEALSKGGDLVKIDNAAENDWLRQTFGPRNYFIGLNDQLVEGSFRWADDSQMPYTNFETGEPNDGEGNQDAAIFAGASGRWFDWSAAYLAYAIIEYTI